MVQERTVDLSIAGMEYQGFDAAAAHTSEVEVRIHSSSAEDTHSSSCFVDVVAPALVSGTNS